MDNETKQRRLTFAQGYADAWARRDRKDNVPEYTAGYDEGVADRARADSPVRRGHK